MGGRGEGIPKGRGVGRGRGRAQNQLGQVAENRVVLIRANMGGEDFLITIPTAIQPVIYGLLENALTEGIAFPPPGQDQHYPVPAVRQVHVIYHTEAARTYDVAVPLGRVIYGRLMQWLSNPGYFLRRGAACNAWGHRARCGCRIPEAELCRICLGIPRDPIYLSCGHPNSPHRFCALCILAWFKVNQQKLCPFCQLPIGERDCKVLRDKQSRFDDAEEGDDDGNHGPGLGGLIGQQLVA